MATPSSMEGKVALVTGAAAGLGRATALRLARSGAGICVVDINAIGLEETAAEVRALGSEALVHATDLADPDNCRAAVDTAVKHFGRLDALCNVAGMMIACHAEEMSDAQWEKIMAVNLGAPFRLFQAAIPHLLEAQGAVVNVTSCAAKIGQAYLAAYCATKGGLDQLTRALAMEYMDKPVRINAVAPGGMDTNVFKTFWDLKDGDPKKIERYSSTRGYVELEEVADMVAFLASDAASGYHGASIAIDNGITAG